MKLLNMAVLALALALTAVVAQADSHLMQHKLEARFKAADKTGDGKLTLEEAKAGMPRVAAMFDQIDTDKKGYITLDQLETFMKSHAPAQ